MNNVSKQCIRTSLANGGEGQVGRTPMYKKIVLLVINSAAPLLYSEVSKTCKDTTTRWLPYTLTNTK
jgi:hypothetical protein